jgi:hypothetical protein
MATWRLRASELLHLPRKAAGVEATKNLTLLASELLHLPGKLAGVFRGDVAKVTRILVFPAYHPRPRLAEQTFPRPSVMN